MISHPLHTAQFGSGDHSGQTRGGVAIVLGVTPVPHRQRRRRRGRSSGGRGRRHRRGRRRGTGTAHRQRRRSHNGRSHRQHHRVTLKRGTWENTHKSHDALTVTVSTEDNSVIIQINNRVCVSVASDLSWTIVSLARYEPASAAAAFPFACGD